MQFALNYSPQAAKARSDYNMIVSDTPRLTAMVERFNALVGA